MHGAWEGRGEMVVGRGVNYFVLWLDFHKSCVSTIQEQFLKML